MTEYYPVPAGMVPGTGERTLLWCQGREIALFNVDGELFAIDDCCPHQGASLSGGRLEGAVVQCCAHGLRFSLATGCMVNSSKVRVASFPVKRRDGQVYIFLSEESQA